MSERLEDLDSLKELLAEDPEAVTEIEYQRSAIDEWIAEHPEAEFARAPRRHQLSDSPELSGGERSIFDDIDAEEAPEEQ